MKQKNIRKGFSLAELLIVVAIITVLTAIAIPLFNEQLERSREAVDMANMRNAYAVLATGINTGELERGQKYLYDASDNTLTTERRPEPYGKAKTVADKWWKGSGIASGIPKDRSLQIQIDDDGTVYYWWSETYTGMKVTDPTQHSELSYEERVERDLILLNSLQDKFRDMTYGQLHDLFFDENNQLREQFTGKAYTGDSNQDLVQTLDKSMCVTIAESTIVSSAVQDGEKYHNKIYLSELFESAGYSISEETTENYILNSVNGTGTNNKGKNARLWVNLGISKSDLQKLNENSEIWNTPASKSYTYLKGAGLTTDASVSQVARSQQ